jgi:hypothetical protein
LALNAAFRNPLARAHVTNTNAPVSIRCRRHAAGRRVLSRRRGYAGLSPVLRRIR